MRHWITSHFPNHLFYAEPFAGAASVLLSKVPARHGEIINDLNDEIINLFRVVRCPVAFPQLMERLRWTVYAVEEFREARKQFTDPVKKAWATVVRSFMGISVSGIRENSGFRMGNVSLATYDQEGKRTFRNCARDWSGWKENLVNIRDRLANVMIYSMDAVRFIRLMDSPDCLLYVDPPYVHQTRSDTRYKIDLPCHQDLITALLTTKSKVVLSGYENEDYECFDFMGWRKVSKKSRANMSTNDRTEYLWISPNV